MSKPLWEVLEVSDDLCLKVKEVCDRLYDFQSPEVYLRGAGEIRIVVDNVLFDVGEFYDGGYLVGRFLEEDGIEVVREAVAGCTPYHPRYDDAVKAFATQKTQIEETDDRD